MPRSNQLRIIGGRYRGRKLSFPTAPDLRPTTDRIRETLFNWLAPVLAQARCLDLYAGSGSLGIEAISRGAAEVVFVESAPAVAKQLRTNLMLLCVHNATLNEIDVLHYLNHVAPSTFDIVFLDPPYSLQIQSAVLTRLVDRGWVGDTSLIYVEANKAYAIQVPLGWRWYREKTAGQVRYGLLQKTPSLTLLG